MNPSIFKSLKKHYSQKLENTYPAKVISRKLGAQTIVIEGSTLAVRGCCSYLTDSHDFGLVIPKKSILVTQKEMGIYLDFITKIFPIEIEDITPISKVAIYDAYSGFIDLAGRFEIDINFAAHMASALNKIFIHEFDTIKNIIIESIEEEGAVIINKLTLDSEGYVDNIETSSSKTIVIKQLREAFDKITISKTTEVELFRSAIVLELAILLATQSKTNISMCSAMSLFFRAQGLGWLTSEINGFVKKRVTETTLKPTEAYILSYSQLPSSYGNRCSLSQLLVYSGILSQDTHPLSKIIVKKMSDLVGKRLERIVDTYENTHRSGITQLEHIVFKVKANSKLKFNGLHANTLLRALWNRPSFVKTLVAFIKKEPDMDPYALFTIVGHFTDSVGDYGTTARNLNHLRGSVVFAKRPKTITSDQIIALLRGTVKPVDGIMEGFTKYVRARIPISDLQGSACVNGNSIDEFISNYKKLVLYDNDK